MALSEKPNVIFFRPKKMGDCMYLRQRQKIYLLLGASWKVCISAGQVLPADRCWTWFLTGSESHLAQVAFPRPTSWKVQISKGRAQGPEICTLQSPSCLYLSSCTQALFTGSIFVYLECRITIEAEEINIFRAVKKISIWVATLEHITFFHQKESR